MDSFNSDESGAVAPEPLCRAAAQELLMRSYTIRTLNRYKRVWEQLADFAHAEGGTPVYSRELALRFEQAYGLRSGEVLKTGQRWRWHLVYGIKVLDDFARTGTITRFTVETTGLRVPLDMHKALRRVRAIREGAKASAPRQPGRAHGQRRHLPGFPGRPRPDIA